MRTALTSFTLALSIGTIVWGSTRVYSTYCVPAGFNGLVQSFITGSSAPCHAILSLLTNTSALYSTMIAALFVGIFSTLKAGIEKLIEGTTVEKTMVEKTMAEKTMAEKTMAEKTI